AVVTPTATARRPARARGAWCGMGMGDPFNRVRRPDGRCVRWPRRNCTTCQALVRLPRVCGSRLRVSTGLPPVSLLDVHHHRPREMFATMGVPHPSQEDTLQPVAVVFDLDGTLTDTE